MALTTHLQPESRLKKKESNKSAPLLSLRGLLEGKLYLFTLTFYTSCHFTKTMKYLTIIIFTRVQFLLVSSVQ
jgi:hypothetical protein